MHTPVRRWALSLLAFVAACGITDVESPDTPLFDQLTEELDVTGLESVMKSGDVEFSLELLEDGVTASELFVNTEEMPEEERIQSRIVSIDESGSMTLLLGDIDVSFGSGTSFWLDDLEVSRNEFTDAVHAELAAGRKAPVIAERPVPASAPSPTDDEFEAGKVILGGDGAPRLLVRVAAGHLETVDNPTGDEPDAFVTVLNHRLSLRVRHRRTKVCRQRVRGFVGIVEAIDLDERTFTLDDGRVFRVNRRTHWVRRWRHPRNLEQAFEVLEAGYEVKARLRAHTRAVDGAHLVRQVSLRKGELVRPPVVVQDFEGVVSSVQQGEGEAAVVLANGTRVLVTASTEVGGADDVSPASLTALVEALEAGREVFAHGEGEVVSESPTVLKGLRVTLRSDAVEEEEFDPFAGRLDVVSDDGVVLLVNGLAVFVTDDTEIEAGNDYSPTSVDELRQWIDLNRVVEVSGLGTFEGEQEVVAAQLVLTSQVEAFDSDVAFVAFFGMGLVLDNGEFVLVTDETTVTPVGDGPANTSDVESALAAGDRVRATGFGYVTSGDPDEGIPYEYEGIVVELEQFPAS